MTQDEKSELWELAQSVQEDGFSKARAEIEHAVATGLPFAATRYDGNRSNAFMDYLMRAAALMAGDRRRFARSVDFLRTYPDLLSGLDPAFLEKQADFYDRWLRRTAAEEPHASCRDFVREILETEKPSQGEHPAAPKQDNAAEDSR